MPTYQELKAQAEELLRQAEMLRKEERREALADIKRKIGEWGFSASDLGFGGGAKKATAGKRAVVAPKYRDPASGQTWSGRGQPPKWLQAYLNAGRKRDEFLIR